MKILNHKSKSKSKKKKKDSPRKKKDTFELLRSNRRLHKNGKNNNHTSTKPLASIGKNENHRSLTLEER